MSGKGTCSEFKLVRISGSNDPGDHSKAQNAMVETFFRTIKVDLIWPVAWQSRTQAENAIARYIDGFYSPARRPSSLGFRSPIAVEAKAREVS